MSTVLMVRDNGVWKERRIPILYLNILGRRDVEDKKIRAVPWVADMKGLMRNLHPMP